jgi:hypothetical protein
MTKKSEASAAFQLAQIRHEIISYCDDLPKIIQTHGRDSLGSVTLSLGKCFKWIGPTLDQYSIHQPLPGQSLPTVSSLGEQLRVIGLGIMHKPDDGDLKRTIETLKRQVALLTKLSKLQGGAN